jgi:hypothetical protein
MYCRDQTPVSGSFLYRLDQLSNEPRIAHIERSESVLRVGQTIRSPSSTGRSGPIASFNAGAGGIGHMPHQVALGVNT